MMTSHDADSHINSLCLLLDVLYTVVPTYIFCHISSVKKDLSIQMSTKTQPGRARYGIPTVNSGYTEIGVALYHIIICLCVGAIPQTHSQNSFFLSSFAMTFKYSLSDPCNCCLPYYPFQLDCSLCPVQDRMDVVKGLFVSNVCTWLN